MSRPPRPSATARYRAARELIERLAVKQPLVLVLDDLHWADGASLELASHLFRRPPARRVVLAVGLRRDRPTTRLEAVMDSALRGSESVHSISARPAGARRRAGAHGPRRPGGGRMRLSQERRKSVLHARADSRAGDEKRGPRSAEDEGDVPSAVVAAIVRELDGLSVPARRLAEAGAVAGDPFELDLALAAAGLGEPDALDAIDELAARDLVRSAAAPRRFHFRHPLVRHAVYESCAPGMRLAAHEHCADALAAQGAPAAMRAHHVQHAARHGDLGAVAVLREAGAAAARRAPASAARWFELALGLLPETAPREDRIALLMAIAETEAAIGRFENSREAVLDSLAACHRRRAGPPFAAHRPVRVARAAPRPPRGGALAPDHRARSASRTTLPPRRWLSSSTSPSAASTAWTSTECANGASERSWWRGRSEICPLRPRARRRWRSPIRSPGTSLTPRLTARRPRLR